MTPCFFMFSTLVKSFISYALYQPDAISTTENNGRGVYDDLISSSTHQNQGSPLSWGSIPQWHYNNINSSTLVLDLAVIVYFFYYTKKMKKKKSQNLRKEAEFIGTQRRRYMSGIFYPKGIRIYICRRIPSSRASTKEYKVDKFNMPIHVQEKIRDQLRMKSWVMYINLEQYSQLLSQFLYKLSIFIWYYKKPSLCRVCQYYLSHVIKTN